MSTSWTNWLSESLRDTERRRGFGAEGVKTALAFALLDARESAGMTRSELADASGVSEAYISKLERGDANPAIGKIGEIFAAMRMKPTVGFAPLMAESEKADAPGQRFSFGARDRDKQDKIQDGHGVQERRLDAERVCA